MKLLCNRAKLATAFATAASIAPSRSPKAILQNVKLTADENRAILSATDLEVGVLLEVEGVDVQQVGSTVLPVSRFGGLLKELADETITLQQSSKGLVVKGERSKHVLSVQNPAEFPGQGDWSSDRYHTLSSAALKALIQRTLFATDTASSRYALGGVLLEINRAEATAVATDGRRMAIASCPAVCTNGHATGESQRIVPFRAMQQLVRLLDSGEVMVCCSDNDIRVRTPTATFTARLLEGRFPRWKDAIPDLKHGQTVTLPAGATHAALRQAAIATSDESRGVDFRFEGGKLLLSGRTAEVGESEVELPISYDGPQITLTMDHRYVSEFLRTLDPSDNATVQIRDSESAAIFSAGDAYRYVVMPLAGGV